LCCSFVFFFLSKWLDYFLLFFPQLLDPILIVSQFLCYFELVFAVAAVATKTTYNNSKEVPQEALFCP
jgi:uncharacterized membrane protein